MFGLNLTLIVECGNDVALGCVFCLYFCPWNWLILYMIGLPIKTVAWRNLFERMRSIQLLPSWQYRDVATLPFQKDEILLSDWWECLMRLILYSKQTTDSAHPKICSKKPTMSIQLLNKSPYPDWSCWLRAILQDNFAWRLF